VNLGVGWERGYSIRRDNGWGVSERGWRGGGTVGAVRGLVQLEIRQICRRCTVMGWLVGRGVSANQEGIRPSSRLSMDTGLQVSGSREGRKNLSSPSLRESKRECSPSRFVEELSSKPAKQKKRQKRRRRKKYIL